MAISPGGRPADDSPLAKTPEADNWVDKAGGLPTYIREIAHALVRKGMTTSHAIAVAVTRVKVLAATSDNPTVKAAAAEALAHWEGMKATKNDPLMLEVKDIVRTLDGAMHYGQPIGSTIRRDQRAAADIRTPFVSDTPAFHRAGKTERLMMARSNFAKLQEQVKAIVAMGDDYKAKNAAESELHRDWGLNLDDLEQMSYDQGDDFEVDDAVISELTARTGPWPGYFSSCRQIRRRAYEMLGFEDHQHDRADVHIGDRTGPTGTANVEIPDEQADTLAYSLLHGIRHQTFPQTLYRGVNLHGYSLPESLHEGNTIDLPLISTADDEYTVGRYGKDVTFEFRRARAVKGGPMGPWHDPDDPNYSEADHFNDDYDDDESGPHEYVTGGRFHIDKVEKITPTKPEIPKVLLDEEPFQDDFKDEHGEPDEDAYYEKYDEWRDDINAWAEDNHVRVDQDAPWIVEWDEDTDGAPRYKVTLTQLGVFDPDTGEVQSFERKSMPARTIPDCDWMFDGSLRNPQEKAPMQSKSIAERIEGLAYKFDSRRVASHAGEERFGKRIGELIGGHTFKTPDALSREFGRKRGTFAYSNNGHDKVSAYDGGVVIHSAEPGAYEHDVAAIMTPSAAVDTAHALHKVMNGIHHLAQHDPDEVVAEGDADLVTPLTEVTPDGVMVGIRPDGQVLLSYPIGEHNHQTYDEHLLSWDEAGRLMAALDHAGRLSDQPDTMGDPDVYEGPGRDIADHEMDPG